MKPSILLSVIFSAAMLSCNAQQSQRREIQPFSVLQTQGSVSVFYTHGDSLQLLIKAKGDEFEFVETKLENGVLRISNKSATSGPVSIHLQNNRLIRLETSGATSFRSQNTITSDSLALHVSGSSNVRLSGNVKQLQLTQSGASDVTLSGESESLAASVSGAAALKAYELTAKNGTVTTTGAANAKVHFINSAIASAAGASDIRIKGDPKDLSSSTSAAASVTRVKTNASGKSADTTAYNWNNKKIIIVQDNKEKEIGEKKDNERSFKHWRGFSAGVNGYLPPSGSLVLNRNHAFMDLNYARSFNLQLNFIERHFNLVSHHVKLVTGLGIDFHLYELANNASINADSSYTWGAIDSSNTFTYRKNKFRNTYIQVPLLVEFNTSKDPDKTFHIAFGVIGQYLIGSRSKQILEQDNDEYRKIRKDDFNLSPFAAKAHVNFGYRGWTLFGEYSLTPMFQSGRGPELYPFTAGIRVIPFS